MMGWTYPDVQALDEDVYRVLVEDLIASQTE